MTPIDSVRISAPSRLHFGLLAFGDAHDRQYGGLGVMIDRPRLVLTVRRADRLEVHGPESERALVFAQRVLRFLDRREHGIRIDVEEAPRPHTGLGTGTQLGMSVARALFTLFDRGAAHPSELARAAERGERSAVGTHGFDCGGLIFEEGKGAHDHLGRLTKRVELPANWRFMLLVARDSHGLAGNEETQAFDQLPPVPANTTEMLRRIAMDEILPAAEQRNFDAFSDAIYRYGYAAGKCFVPQQSGPFASPTIEATVKSLRDRGIQGVGQSSWGPTVFALVKDNNVDSAISIAKSATQGSNTDILVAAPAATGASVEVSE